MSMSPQPPPERNELHNASVDEGLAGSGRCATVHLPTGRVCTLEHGHDGSCDFTPADEARGICRS